MSWFQTTNIASFAKNKLKEVQQSIDKALDIKDEQGNSTGSATTVASVTGKKYAIKLAKYHVVKYLSNILPFQDSKGYSLFFSQKLQLISFPPGAWLQKQFQTRSRIHQRQSHPSLL